MRLDFRMAVIPEHCTVIIVEGKDEKALLPSRPPSQGL